MVESINMEECRVSYSLLWEWLVDNSNRDNSITNSNRVDNRIVLFSDINLYYILYMYIIYVNVCVLNFISLFIFIIRNSIYY